MSAHNSLGTARVIASSSAPSGIVLTTMELRYWRPIHPEFMTHRQFSRNAGSSRARPTKAIRQQVLRDPWGPQHWGFNQPGMQAHHEATGLRRTLGRIAWRTAAVCAAGASWVLEKLGFHKQLVNRALEPFTYIDVVVSSTDWANWEALRLDPDAQPEIRQLAQVMKDARDSFKPKDMHLSGWHLPYADSAQDKYDAQLYMALYPGEFRTYVDVLIRMSVARCARVSYKLFDGTNPNVEADLKLYDRLVGSQPLHASPLEHQAVPDSCTREFHRDSTFTTRWDNPDKHGNFRGWRQYRKMVANEYVPG